MHGRMNGRHFYRRYSDVPSFDATWKKKGGGGENWGEIFEGSQTRITLVVDLSIGRVKTRWREKKSEIPTDGGRGVSIGRAINRARKTAQLLIVVGRPVCGMGIGHRSKIYSRFRIRVSTSFPPRCLIF